MEDTEYLEFIRNVKKLTGLDLSLYKDVQMNRRMRLFYNRNGYESYKEYFEGLQRNPEQLKDFYDRMTINVTEFYRNPNRWEVVSKDIVPKILERKKKIKCWSSACSSGEEAYTLAMILKERCHAFNFEVLATDIDERMLARAQKGVYPAIALKECPQRYIERYFQKTDDEYRIKEELKKTVSFAHLNLLHDSLPSGMDLIACRNVMIYFTEEAKKDLYQALYQSLSDEGFLFVGSTEQIFRPEMYGFTPYKSFFYQKMK